MTIPFRQSLPSVMLTIIYYVVSIAFVHANSITEKIPAAPVINTPVNNTVFNTTDWIIAGTAELGVNIIIYIDGKPLEKTSTDEAGNWSIAFSATSLADGRHNIRATAVNAEESISALSNTISIVLDVTPPSAITVHMSSNNSNRYFAKAGDIVTVYFTVDKAIYLPDVTIAGHTATVTSVGPEEYVARYTMTMDDAEGQIPFRVSFMDLHGNSGEVIVITTDNTKVYFDKKQPTVTLNTLESSPIKNAFLVYISFSEAIADFNLKDLQVTNAKVSDLTNISNNIMTILVTPQYDGLVSLQLNAGAAHDAAGNPSLASGELKMEAVFGGYFEKIFPNPATGIIQLQFRGTVNEKTKVLLTSYAGITRYDKDLIMDDKVLRIDVSNIPAGPYILTVRSKNYNFYMNVMVVH